MDILCVLVQEAWCLTFSCVYLAKLCSRIAACARSFSRRVCFLGVSVTLPCPCHRFLRAKSKNKTVCHLEEVVKHSLLSIWTQWYGEHAAWCSKRKEQLVRHRWGRASVRVCAETGGQWKGVVVSVSQIPTQTVSSFKLGGGGLLVPSYYCKDKKPPKCCLLANLR